MRHLRRYELVALICALLFLVVAAVPAVMVLKDENRLSLTRYPFVQNFLPFYHALRKLPDVLFFPYYFRSETLPTYTLNLTLKDMQTLNAGLPPNAFGTSTLNDVARVRVKAEFQTTDGYDDLVQVRYRGSIANNWNTSKRSYQIYFPSTHLYRGMRQLTLFIPSDRDYFVEPLNYYRGKKLGLNMPDLFAIRLKMNNQDEGVYLASEHWSQEWLEKNQHSADSNIIGANASDLTGGKFVWQSWNIVAPASVRKPKSQILTGSAATSPDSTDTLAKTLTDIVEHASDADFERYLPYIVDMQKLYAAEVVAILAGTYHSDGYLSPTGNPNVNLSGDINLVLVFDTDKGLFEPIPYNVSIMEVPPEGGIVEMPSYLTRRVYSIPAFKAARDRMLKAYLDDPSNLEDDQAFIAKWQREVQPGLYTDNSKLENNFQMIGAINRTKRYVEENFARAHNEIGRTYERPAVDVRPLLLQGSFVFLPQTVISPAAFVASHPEFYRGADGTIHLSTGRHYFTKTVTVPKGTRLVIDPGATLLFGPDVSFVSYSPVTARGTRDAPIRLLPSGDLPWGNFAVANAGRQMSYFDQVYLRYGGDTHVNGIHMSGTLSLKDSDAEIARVTVEGAQGDDGIHLAHGSYTVADSIFRNNWADPIDSDFTTSTFEDNVFINTVPISTLSYDGDAMDVSGSTVTIRGNYVYGMGDKGMSIGENSTVTAENNVVVGSVYGVAVKDLSRATLLDNVFINNKTGIALYQKKPIWGGGTATSTGSVLYGNGSETSLDKLSQLTLVDTVRPASDLEARAKIPPALLPYWEKIGWK
jgi:hypothetical protein